MMIQGPFYSFRDAAAYCGYHPETLARILREEGIDLPRSGPRGNRYAKSVLDAFMASPDTFKAAVAPAHRRRAPKPVTV